ncbi:DUF2288 domain-containing protein [Pseudanabaena sp. PCC 6802]|uniref:DUF2288 domain-containing protein n=1 Tax=Pseudanabaena sp. PCC 6802 TaxID=118173 RepID=UPI00034ABEAA|nr:DUF2288 domain-containing protein [Pseudanabaena sp. PCC 6802]
MSDLRAELTEMMDVAEWGWLEEHALRSRLFLVSSSLDLVDVGVAIAQDNVALVQQWLEHGLLAHPTEEQFLTWNQNKEQTFPSLIVQPFVLMKLA